MAEKTTHIIHKLVVEVETSTTSRGFELKDNAGKFVQEKVIPVVEEYIRELEKQLYEGETMELDKLVVNMEAPTNDFSDPAWRYHLSDSMEKTIGKVTERIRQERSELGQKKTLVLENQMTLIEDDPIETPAETEHEIGKLRFESPTERNLKAVFYFLGTGHRPWWVTSSHTMVSLLEPSSLRLLLTKEKMIATRLFQKQVVIEKNVERWIRQLSDEQLMLFLSHLTTNNEIVWEQFITKRLFFNSYSEPLKRNVREAFWKTLLVSRARTYTVDQHILQFFIRQLSSDGQKLRAPDLIRISLPKDLIQLLEAVRFSSDQSAPISVEKIVDSFIERLDSSANITPSTIFGLEKKNKRGVTSSDEQHKKTETKHLDNEMDPLPEKVTGVDRNKDTKIRETEAKEAYAVDDHSKEVPPIDLKREVVSSFETTEKETIATEAISEGWKPWDETALVDNAETETGIILENAGLVIVHPFLKYFFKDIGLVDDNDQITDKNLAAHVLHYLATGNVGGYEHAMQFEKYLVGIPFEEPLYREVTFSPDIFEKTKTLLNTVRTNWEPLSGTSDDGIRETFLVREGKLMLSEEFDRLIIEKQTVDILMDKLGWSLSMIHLPWKEGVLYVEWY